MIYCNVNEAEDEELIKMKGLQNISNMYDV